ncbi:hypothetical protein [Ornithinimicrobium kibberense]
MPRPGSRRSRAVRRIDSAPAQTLQQRAPHPRPGAQRQEKGHPRPRRVP